MRISSIAAAVAIGLCAASTVLAAQDTTKAGKTKTTTKSTIHRTRKTETQAHLLKEARITMDSAQVIALAKLPGATVQSGEIERENGRLIYSFDLKRAGRSGIDEVNVNARTGKVVGKVQHESPKTERLEAGMEPRKKKKG